MQVVLDTNFLIDLARFRVDIDELGILINEKYSLTTLGSVINELEKIANSKTRTAVYAKVALKTIKSKKINILEPSKAVDKELLRLGDENNVIATNDSALRNKLKRKGVRIIYLRSKKHLAII